MLRLQAGTDGAVLGLLMERWGDKIRNLCLRITGDFATADDLTQETFARIFASRNRFKPGHNFGTYIRRIAINLCCDELRRRRLRPAPVELVVLSTPAPIADADSQPLAPDSELARREEEGLIRAALAELPEIYQAVLVLRHYENLKLREVAAVLEIPEGTVCSRLAEGLTQLSRLLKPHFPEATRDLTQKKSLAQAMNRRINYATSPA